MTKGQGQLVGLFLVLGLILVVALPDAGSVTEGPVGRAVDGGGGSAMDLLAGGASSTRARVTVDTSWRFASGEYGMVHITGIARNTTGAPINYAMITFNLYDGAGNQIGSAMDNITNLAPHGTWRFKAMVLEPDQVKTARLADVTAF